MAAAASAPTGRQTALVAFSQGVLMAMGAVLALLIAQFFGKDARTDAFFAAYGFYGVGVTLAHTFRLTAVPRLVRTPGPEMVTRLLGAVSLVALVAAVPMVILADPLGGVLVGTEPTGVAPITLRILWITLAAQLVAAMLATILTVRGAYTLIGVATLLTGVVSVSAFLALEPVLGISAAAVGLAISSASLAACLGTVLVRGGWRPAPLSLNWLRETGAEARGLALASATFFGASMAYVVCVAFAARQGGGEATIFAYAYMLATMLVGVTSNAAAMVRSPALIAGEERSANAAAASVWGFRFTVVLVGPIIAIVLLVGEPIIAWALGSQFSDDDIQRVLLTLLCLVAWILASAGAVFAVVELLARGELRRLLGLAVAQVTAVAALAAVAGAWGGTVAIAGALSVVALGAGLVQLRWAFGMAWRGTVAAMARAAMRELLVLGAAFVPAAVLLRVLGDELIGVLAAAALGGLLVIVATFVAWPTERRALLGLMRAPVA